MDSFTHIVLGAVVGEAIGGKELGKRALLFGAVAQYIPDLDVVPALWLPAAQNLVVHRGITHSLLFVAVASVGLAWIAWKFYGRQSFWFWSKFVAVQLLIHVFIDTFNAYGAGLLEPFSSQKFSWHTLYVVDPFFTMWVLAAAIALLIVRNARIRRRWVLVSLLLCTLYLASTILNKQIVVRKVNTAMASQSISHNTLLITPTPLNSWLWFVAAGNDEGFHTSHASVFDADESLQFHFTPSQTKLADQVQDRESLRYLTEFSRDYTFEMWSDTLVFNDLRFGQMKGWENPEARFVFHYYLNYPDENKLVMQRGRFAGWDAQTIKILMRRIAGQNISRAAGNKK